MDCWSSTSCNLDCPDQPVSANSMKDVPEWAKHHHKWPVTTEVPKLKKLEVEVPMCCPTCEQKVREAVCKMCVYECPGGGPDHKKLLKALKKAVHKKAKILDSKPPKDPTPPKDPKPPIVPGPVKPPPDLYPLIWVPWPPPTIGYHPNNLIYLQHSTVCCNCFIYPDVVCGTCGRSSELGALYT